MQIKIMTDLWYHKIIKLNNNVKNMSYIKMTDNLLFINDIK